MNAAHMHLLLNHIPVLGSAAIVGLTILSLYKRNEILARLNFQLMILIGALTIPVYLTGEPAEEIVEDLPNITESIIEHHEELAIYGLGAAILTALVGIAGLYLLRKKKNSVFKLLKANVVISLIVCIVMALIANAGGEIRHTEIHNEDSK